MSRSSTLNNVASVAGGWLFLAVCIVGCIVYFNELRAVGRWAFGVPNPDEIAGLPPRQDQGNLAPAAQSQPVSGNGVVELKADRLGHFSTDAQINGRTIEVMLDTGASIVALTWEDAQQAGIFVRPSDFTHRVNTANGSARVAPVTIESISIGGITVRDVRGTVSEPGRLNGTLLGMTFLSRLSRAELRRGTLILEE